MEWSIFALVQMFIITVGTCLAFWLRLRGVSQQNEQLRQALEAQTDDSDPSPAAWIQAQLDALPADGATTPVIRLVLQHSLNPQGEIESQLRNAFADGGLAVDADYAEQIAALEAELETAKAAAEAFTDSECENDRTEELKQLLQQFTRDSREMMACIQSLETENAELRNRLGLDESEQAEDAA
ncbi:MAG: YtjB family periplasmic protein [Pseudomonadaceae bacterium]|nr:YtjB family periplasmic protein [Pseudomonadaceae bacterium]